MFTNADWQNRCVMVARLSLHKEHKSLSVEFIPELSCWKHTKYNSTLEPD